ncbi:uncharacterized protein LOC141586084 isoform X2 [Silene latifolia]|uniref:uncharacterized protein LOC141586084 isoform X2 n=1 Tax=Silene latifolia TaxID=37657 RepID=UPI003D78A6D3
MELGFVDKDSSFVDQLFSWSVSDVLDHFNHSLIMNKTLDEVRVSGKSYQKHGHIGKLYGPFCFINVTEGRQEVDDDNRGCRNLVEVALVMKIVQRLHEEWRGCSRQLHVTVISPYAAQAAEIERRLGETFGYLINFLLKVKTTEEFQDEEADVVILSTVTSSCTESIDLSSDCQKTDDLFSRARHCLWILGNANTLSKHNTLWETVIANANELNCFVNANKDEEMAQIITNVKSQLDELEDLLDVRSLIFKDAQLKVMFSESFVKSFSKLPSTYSKKIVLNFLLKLANGWQPKKYKADAISGSSSIVKQYRVEGRYIICTNDICKDSGYATQVLKVWDILHLIDVPPLIKKLETVYRSFPDGYLKRSKAKSLEGYVPYTSNADSRRYDFCSDSCGTNYMEYSKVKESLLLMKFYSFSAGVVSHLLSARDGTPINVPFEVTDQERKIILHQGSSFVLGRSGTGKTTVLVMKLFQKEQLHQMASEGFSEMNSNIFLSYPSVFDMCVTGTSLRQLFVTVNPKLCVAVKRHINNFQRFVRGETFGEEKITVNANELDEDENFKDVPSSFIETPLKSYPLVVTFDMLLLMLDRTIGLSYFNRFPDIRKIYSQGTNSRLVQQTLRRREVTFEKFRECYWPHFNMKMTQKLDPLRVFAEINTHIKGSLHFGQQTAEAKSSLERYIQLSDKKGSTFDESERNQIYQIFLDYEKMKLTREEYDSADLVNDVYHRLKYEEYEGDYMDFVYVDEVQDLTMKQLVILKYICKNVKEGFVFAGDTAQTIAKGVHFRFEDMLQVRNYKTAAQCFTRAGEKDWETYTRASELKEAAQNVRSLSVDKSLKMLEEAAQLFESIANRKKAAECYFDAEDFEKAGLIYIGESDIQRAGQCFILAGRYGKAAEIYAKAKLFNECLYACSEGKLFELGLQYIRNWRQGLNELIEEAGIDINASEQMFLEKCAYAAYKQQDREAMMKHVKNFCSFRSMQSFLKKLDCQNELLDLLIDFEKYIEAAKLARHMGKTVLEADLLEKCHHYHEASLLYLASVLAGSLWADDGEGWPIKDFASKEELSLKAKASACKYMPGFHTIVSANIQLLSNDKFRFHDLQQQLAQSSTNQNLMGKIVAARKILDLLLSELEKSGSHSEVSGPKKKVPLNTLCWHWNLWKNDIEKILGYLSSLNGKGPAEYTEYGAFCMEFLGVRERSSDPDKGYFMLYPDANWVKSIPRRSDKKDSLNKWQLMNAGERYWCRELLFVGRKVLDTLQSVLKLSARNKMPVYYRQYIHFQIFQTAAFLLTHCRFLKPTSIDRHSLMSYVDHSADEYFLSVFSLDKMTLLTKESIIQTGFFRNILKEAILRRFDVSVQKKPTLPQLVQVVVVLIGSSRQISEEYKEILRKFQIGSPWKPLLDDLVKGAVQVCHFRDALTELYKSKSEGYRFISPSCFVYLLNQLLVMVSSFSGCLFATRPSFIDWFIHLDCDVNPETFTPSPNDTSDLMTSTYDFLAGTVHELLVNLQGVEEWVNKYGPTSCTTQLLVQNLVILLSLICLNADRYLHLLNDALLRSDVFEQLPTKFREVLVETSGSSFRNVIAKAFKVIGDSLVVVRNPKIVPTMYIRHAVFLDVFNLSKDKIWETLSLKGLTRQSSQTYHAVYPSRT